MRQLVWKQGNHAIPPGSPGFDPRHCKLSGVCCEGGCARPCPGWRFTRLSPIIQHPAGLWRHPEAWPASHSQIVAASVERPDTMCTDTQSRVLLPSEKKKKKQDTLRTRQRTEDNQTSVPGALHHRKPGLGLNDLRGKPSNRSKAAQEPGLKPGTGPRGQTPGHPNQAALLVLRSTAILLRAGSVPHALLAKGRCLPASTRPPLRPGIQLDPPTSPPHQGRRQRHCSVAASSCCC